jgi:hypothetical protein
VGAAQVVDVDVVADAGAVSGVVVAAKNADVWPAPTGGLPHQRDQMGFRVVALAQLAFWVSACGVEVAQAYRLETIRFIIVSQGLLHHQLGAAIGVDGLLRVPLVNGRVLRLAKGGGGGRENELAHPMRTHGVQQAQRVGHVVAVVLVRLLHRLAHLNERGKVHDRIKAFGQNSVQHRTVAKIPLHKVATQNRVAVAAREVVQCRHAAALLTQQLDHVCANVASTTNN